MTHTRDAGATGSGSIEPELARSSDQTATGRARTATGRVLALRAEVERLLRPRPESSSGDAPGLEAARRLVHELQLRQVQLAAENAELRRSRDEVHRSAAHLQDLYDHAPVGYLTVDASGAVVESNLTAARMLGVARDGLVGRPFASFAAEADLPTLWALLGELAAGGSSRTCELRVTGSGGASLWFRLEASMTSDDRGELALFRMTISDITECKRSEHDRSELERRKRQLDKAQSLSRMAEAIAHRFNNLLGAVLGGLELAIGDLPRHGATGVGLDEAMTATLQAAELSTVMLTYLGHSHARRELLDLAELCRRSLPDLRHAAPEQVEIAADLPAAGPVVRADAQQLLRVLTGLTTNAWEALPGGRGVVRLAVTTVPPPQPHAAVRFPLDWQPLAVPYACLEVADDGCGIAEDDLERLFDPFFSTKFWGRGLGLAVVLGITRAHYGAVEVASEVGRGTVVRVLLPTTADADRPPAGSRE